MRHTALALSLLWSSGSMAETAPLPEPLPLTQALRLLEQNHPQLEQAQAALAQAEAERLAAAAGDDVDVRATGYLRWVEPTPMAKALGEQDHEGRLSVSKLLYDFGRQRAAEEAGVRLSESRSHAVEDVANRQRLAVMTAFLQVRLADLEYALANEKMAIAYVDLDKARERHARQQRSDLDLARLEWQYQDILQQRKQAQLQQRLSRERLANSLNRPGELSSQLAAPPLEAILARPLPETEPLLTQLRNRNPSLRALHSELAAADARIEGARAEYGPTLHGRLEANYWERDFMSRDRLRAELVFDLPLYQGDRVKAAIGQAQAARHTARARLAEQELALRQTLLEGVLQLEQLYSEREEIQALTRLRDLELDRNRSLYDLEFATDLGEAMVGQSEVMLRQARNRYQIALQWAELDILCGHELGPQWFEQAPDSKENTAHE